MRALAAADVLVELDEDVRYPEIAVVFRDFVLENHVVPEGVPGQIREHPMILMTVVAIVCEHEVGAKRLERFEIRLDASALKREEAALELLDDNSLLLHPVEKRLRALFRLLGTRALGAEHDPHDLEI